MRTALLLSLLVSAPSGLVLSSGANGLPANGSPAAQASPDANADAARAESSDKKSGEKEQGDEKTKKPSLSLRASPPISFSPANIQLVAELRGGPDDYEEFYCPAVEWDWGDGTKSESSSDCDPYEAGVSQISRRFSKQHVYNLQGRYRVQVRLKRNTKVLTSASTNVQVRAGIREMGPYDGGDSIENPSPAGPTTGRRRP